MKGLMRIWLLLGFLFCGVALAAIHPPQGGKKSSAAQDAKKGTDDVEKFARADDKDEPEQEESDADDEGKAVAEKPKKKGAISRFFSWMGFGDSKKKDEEKKKVAKKKSDDEAEEDEDDEDADDGADSEVDDEDNEDETKDEDDDFFVTEPKVKLTKAEQKAEADKKRQEKLQTKAQFDAERQRITDEKKAYLLEAENRSLIAFAHFMIKELELAKKHEQKFKEKVDPELEKLYTRMLLIYKALRDEEGSKTLKYQAYEWIMGLKDEYMKKTLGTTIKEKFEAQKEQQQLRVLQARIAKRKGQAVSGLPVSGTDRLPLLRKGVLDPKTGKRVHFADQNTLGSLL